MTFFEKPGIFISAALVSSLLAIPAQALPKDHDRVAAQPPAASLDIFNFGQAGPNYFRGAELKGSAASTLAARGVKMVIDLRSDGDVIAAEAQLVTTAGMKYVRIPMTTRTAPTTEQVAKFLSLVTDPTNQPVYVHCVEGRHRTGVMTAIYRMTVDGWTSAQAFDEMKDYKFGLDFLHPEFKQFVLDYHAAPLAAAKTLQAAATTLPEAGKATALKAEKTQPKAEQALPQAEQPLPQAEKPLPQAVKTLAEAEPVQATN